jgi:hypothetical protein
MIMKKFVLIGYVMMIVVAAGAQDANAILQKVKSKLETVNDYVATGQLKTNISFLKVPAATVKVYYKKPARLRIKNEKGVSLVPKDILAITLQGLLNGNYQAIDAGKDTAAGMTVRVIKLLPEDDNNEVVLSKLYIDESRSVILRARTTTRSNGTSELELRYGKYVGYALPDWLSFTFNAQEYKLPKGVTFDYDDGSQAKKDSKPEQNQRGRIDITYSEYIINKGVSDDVFK